MVVVVDWWLGVVVAMSRAGVVVVVVACSRHLPYRRQIGFLVPQCCHVGLVAGIVKEVVVKLVVGVVSVVEVGVVWLSMEVVILSPNYFR